MGWREKQNEKLKTKKVLVVGAGGIGCELLKNLVLTGFKNIHVIDLDTIDVTNLNRQFLFRREHVGKSKAEVATAAVRNLQPDVNITFDHGSIFQEDFGLHFFQRFDFVLNALDNRAARTHVNRLCLAARVPLIDSGSSGYSGQVTNIIRERSECFECIMKPAPKSYPSCTIRNTPSEHIHCIVWAKHLFNQLFGEIMIDDDVSPDLEDVDKEAEGTASNDTAEKNTDKKETSEEKGGTRAWAEKVKYDGLLLFKKLFFDDISYLLKMDHLWKTRRPPTPLTVEVIEEKDGGLFKDTHVGDDALKVWTALESARVFIDSMKQLYDRKTQLSEDAILYWDKDDDDAMRFVASAANIRAIIFNIKTKNVFDIKSMAGNIIPAIATTNAMVAGMIVVEALKYVNGNINELQNVFIRSQPNPKGQVLCAQILEKPNPKCFACGDKREIFVQVNTNLMTIKTLEDVVLKGALLMLSPDVMEKNNSRIIISSEEGETTDLQGKTLSEMMITNGVILACDDFLQKLEFNLFITHSDKLTPNEYEILQDSSASENNPVTPSKDETMDEDTKDSRKRKSVAPTDLEEISNKRNKMSPDVDDENEFCDDDVIGCLPRQLPDMHRELLESLVEAIPTLSDETSQQNNESRFLHIIKVYQLQPALLDGVIPQLIEKLLSFVDLSVPADSSLAIDLKSSLAFKRLAYISDVRGYKTVVRLLPHTVTYLDKILIALERLSVASSSLEFYSRRMLLLWLWIVCKNPFDLRRFDPQDSPGKTMQRIFSVTMPYLSSLVIMHQYQAALVISQCLARSDGVHLIEEVLTNQFNYLSQSASCDKLLGSLLLTLSVLKHVERKHIIDFVEPLMNEVSKAFPLKSSSEIVRKSMVKIVQRSALVLLKPKLATWRYRRGRRRIEDNLSQGNDSDDDCKENQPSQGVVREEEDDNDNIHPLIEFCLDCVLTSLSDDSTIVRWSAAKGVGRITARLNKHLAVQVVESIMSRSFHPHAGNGAWHGGCMALAELSRRGFLLPELLHKVFPVVRKALFYEEPMGRHVLGNNVRDSACYVFWAFARAYEPTELRPFLDKVATSLMCVALFDREINLRRAASAAFQENVGRQLNFPDGIALLTLIDFFAVGKRANCFTKLCVEVVQYPKYRDDIIDHLIEYKIVHWDPVIRKQAATALNLMAPHHSAYICSCLPKLLAGCTHTSPIKRHGFVMATAHCLKGLLDASYKSEIVNEILKELGNIPANLHSESEKLKSSGGELTRFSLLEFMTVLSRAAIALSSEQVMHWALLIEQMAKDSEAKVREAAKVASSVFFPTYFVQEQNAEILHSTQKSFEHQLTSLSIEYQALGLCNIARFIPSKLFTNDLYNTVSKLVLEPGSIDKKWAMMRAAAVETLTDVYLDFANPEWKDKCYESIFKGLGEYTEDNTGDIGRKVREISLKCLASLLIHPSTKDDDRKHYIVTSVGKMIQQSAERIGGTRQCACEAIRVIITCEDTRKFVPHVEDLDLLYSDSSLFTHDNVLLSLSPILFCDEYYEFLVHGLMISAGGLSDVTSKHASQVILEYLNIIGDDVTLVEKLLKTISDMLSKGIKVVRIRDCVLRFLPQLLCRLPNDIRVIESSPSLSEILLITEKIVKARLGAPFRIRLGLEAFSALLCLPQSSPLWTRSVRLLASSLSNHMPAIRRAAAESLYEALCVLEIDEEILDLLCQTAWHDTSNNEEIMTKAARVQTLFNNII
ncbi:unnamed protein product [Auanema sp. JU1783]|nr:unnamed protein product [Auanema sp. JU1783]